MNEDKFEETSRDILVELRGDVRHMRAGMDKFQVSDTKQWEKLDVHGQKLEGHEKEIGSLTKGFWVLVTGMVSGTVSIIFWLVTHSGK
jgi:hypothetical protein